MLKRFATDVDDPTEHPSCGRVGKQTIGDTGPLDSKRMETIDDDIVAIALDFIERKHAEGTPFFAWINGSSGTRSSSLRRST